MKMLATNQIKEADRYTIENEPVKSINLMERAARECTKWVISRYKENQSFVVFAGPGNNGGDGLAIARQLAEMEYPVQVYRLDISGKMAPDAQVNLDRLQQYREVETKVITATDEIPALRPNDIIIDALFGSGLSRPLEGVPAELVRYLNKIDNTIIAIDMPSGLFGEDNGENTSDTIIKATYTLTFQFPKLAFFFPENAPFIGTWEVLSIGLHEGYIQSIKTPYHYSVKADARQWIKKREKHSHKGHFGHGLLISGSYGMMGAAVLASRAAMRTGIGLLTAHVPRQGYQIVQTSVPEAIVDMDGSDILFSGVNNPEKYSAVGVGPGIGTKPNVQKALEQLLTTVIRPVVIDADAINILGQNREWLRLLPENSILTPHPKEFERLTHPVKDQYQRCKLVQEFAEANKVVVVLKGAHTVVTNSDGELWFNTTGNPGMATAGSGDVLTGMVLALLAQEYEPFHAARLSVFVHGLAGDLAAKKYGMISLTASDIIKHLGKAFKKLSN